MGLIEKLEEEIWQQTRNGRKDVYIDADDLRALGYYINENKKGRTFINVEELREYIRNYKKKDFKESLKVEVKPQQTYREFIKELKDIERNGEERN